MDRERRVTLWTLFGLLAVGVGVFAWLVFTSPWGRYGAALSRAPNCVALFVAVEEVKADPDALDWWRDDGWRRANDRAVELAGEAVARNAITEGDICADIQLDVIGVQFETGDHL